MQGMLLTIYVVVKHIVAQRKRFEFLLRMPLRRQLAYSSVVYCDAPQYLLSPGLRPIQAV